jgi:hypothetical protein
MNPDSDEISLDPMRFEVRSHQIWRDFARSSEILLDYCHFTPKVVGRRSVLGWKIR